MKLFMLGIALMFCMVGYAWASTGSSSSSSDWDNRPEPYTMIYRGQPLHCLVVEDGSRAGTIGGLTCDFNRFYRAH